MRSHARRTPPSTTRLHTYPISFFDDGGHFHYSTYLSVRASRVEQLEGSLRNITRNLTLTNQKVQTSRVIARVISLLCHEFTNRFRVLSAV